MLKLGSKRLISPNVPKSLGYNWDEEGNSEIVEIQITHELDCIKSIQFTYLKNGQLSHSQVHGSPTGSNYNMVEFDYAGGEVLTSVSGDYRNGLLTSITFGTNKRNYGPFGKTDLRSQHRGYDHFNYEFKPGRFGGFHGIVWNKQVHAIGVYVKPYVPNSAPDIKPSHIRI